MDQIEFDLKKVLEQELPELCDDIAKMVIAQLKTEFYFHIPVDTVLIGFEMDESGLYKITIPAEDIQNGSFIQNGFLEAVYDQMKNALRFVTCTFVKIDDGVREKTGSLFQKNEENCTALAIYAFDIFRQHHGRLYKVKTTTQNGRMICESIEGEGVKLPPHDGEEIPLGLGVVMDKFKEDLKKNLN